MLCTASCSAGVSLPFANSPARSGTPCSASQARCSEPRRVSVSLVASDVSYAGRSPTTVGAAPDTSRCLASCVRKSEICAAVGVVCASVVFSLDAGSVSLYTVFDDASKTLTCVGLHTTCTSPASDCSSIRPCPSFVIQRRPEAPERSADPALPKSALEGRRLFVKVTRAVTPAGCGAASASCSASASDFGGGAVLVPELAAAARARGWARPPEPGRADPHGAGARSEGGAG